MFLHIFLLTSLSISSYVSCGLHLRMLGHLRHVRIRGPLLSGRILRRRLRGHPSQPYFFLEYLKGIHLPISFIETKYHLAIRFPLHPHSKPHTPIQIPRFFLPSQHHHPAFQPAFGIPPTDSSVMLDHHNETFSDMVRRHPTRPAWASIGNTDTSWPAPAPMLPPQVPQHQQPQAPPTSTSAPPPSSSPAPPTSPSRPPATPKRAASHPSRHRREVNITNTLKSYLNQIQDVVQSSIQPAPVPPVTTPAPPPTDPPHPPASCPRSHHSQSQRHSTLLPRLRHARRSRSRSLRRSRHHSPHRRSPVRPPRTPSRHRRRPPSPRHSTPSPRPARFIWRS